MMSNPFGKKNWFTAAIAVLFAMAATSSVHAQFGGVFQQIGGVWVNPSGVLSEATETMKRDVRQLVAQDLDAVSDEIRQSTQLRMISLKGLETALRDAVDNGTELPDEIKYMAGIQRIQFLFVDSQENDIILAGPGEGWTVDASGNVVGVTTGRPVIRFEDFIVALRTADEANKDYGISVSINPTDQGVARLKALTRRGAFNPSMQSQVEEALGPQNITLTGLPTDSRLAQILVAADYRMKRMAMGFEKPPIEGMPSVLEIAQKRGRSVNMSPRFWMECSYQPLRRSEDGLSWELRGPGVKTLTESQAIGAANDKKIKDHPVAKQWAQTMTDKFTELANADPVFAEMQNVMDMAVIAALLQKHNLLSKANLEIPHISGDNDAVALPKWSVPKTVNSQCSFVRIKNSWMMTASGGVQIDSWAIIKESTIDNAIADVRNRALGASDKAWWNSVN